MTFASASDRWTVGGSIPDNCPSPFQGCFAAAGFDGIMPQCGQVISFE